MLAVTQLQQLAALQVKQAVLLGMKASQSLVAS